MLVVMQSHATDEQVRAVCERIESLGFKALPVPGAGRTAVVHHWQFRRGGSGLAGIHARRDRMHPGQQAVQAGQPRRQSGKHRRARPHAARRRRLRRRGCRAWSRGPCAIETREQAFTVAKHVKAAGARLFRGGAYKPRTSPYSFPRSGRSRPGNHGRRAQGIRPGHHHRSD